MSETSSFGIIDELGQKAVELALDRAKHVQHIRREQQLRHGGGKRDKLHTRNPKWRGGIRHDGHGRVIVYCPHHPRPNFDKCYVYRYRLIMEMVLGRLLERNEIVHHLNGDPSDDRVCNLRVMTQAEHAAEHMLERMAGRWSMKFDRCQSCGTTARKHYSHGQCGRCAQRRMNQTIV